MSTRDENLILHSEVHFFTSALVGTEFQILVGKVGLTEDSPPVVLYLSDANTSFGGVMNILSALRWAGYVPPVLVVGIGYRVQDETETLAPRSRDLTPSTYEGESEWPSGGAPQFLQFIREELKPWVAKTFDVDPDDDVFFGFSYGGLFGTYVLLTQPDTFKRYGIVSQSLWFNSKSMFELEAVYASSHDDLVAKAYFSVGELETPEGKRIHREWLPEDKRAAAEAKAAAEAERGNEVNMVEDVQQMVAVLKSRNYHGLSIDSEVLADEFHLTGGFALFSHSMRFLFDAPLRRN
ncbi:MAG: alpha/beta hydrolase [Acidimicrobiales bacterium]